MALVNYFSQSTRIECLTGNDKLLAIGRVCAFLLKNGYRRESLYFFIKETYSLEEKDVCYYVNSALNFLNKQESSIFKLPNFKIPEDDDDKRCMVVDFVKKDYDHVGLHQYEFVAFGILLESLGFDVSRLVVDELPIDKKDKKHALFLINLGRAWFLSKKIDEHLDSSQHLGFKTVENYYNGFFTENKQSSFCLDKFGLGCKRTKIPIEKAVSLAKTRSNMEDLVIFDKISKVYQRELTDFKK